VATAGCVNQPGVEGRWLAPSFVALQQMCPSVQQPDYGSTAPRIYWTVHDAYVASRHGKLTHEQFCAFQASLAQHYTALAQSTDAKARNEWVAWFNNQRAAAVNWRAAVDPSLRGF
jgi:hypothetical protein